jgi:biopolymer transport protein TolR
MSMTAGGPGGINSDINVTPLIDVLLVLLIIFMVIVPVVPKGLDALVPQPPKTPQQENNSDRTIVVQVLQSGGSGSRATYKINQDDVNKVDLPAKLATIYANRAERVMFVKGDDDVNFALIADVIDIAHSAGVDHVGLMTPKIQAGQ